MSDELANRWYLTKALPKATEAGEADPEWFCGCHKVHRGERCEDCGDLFGNSWIATRSDGMQIASVWLIEFIERHPEIDWLNV